MQAKIMSSIREGVMREQPKPLIHAACLRSVTMLLDLGRIKHLDSRILNLKTRLQNKPPHPTILTTSMGLLIFQTFRIELMEKRRIFCKSMSSE